MARKPVHFFVLIAAGIAAVLAFAPALSATTRYTDDSGAVTSGTCATRTVGTGACTLSYAVSQLANSDTLVLLDGTYTGANGRLCHTVPSGTSGNPTIIKA